MVSNILNNKILLDPVLPDSGLADIRESIQGLPETFGKEVEGDSKLELVIAMDEIRKEYEELLTMYRAVFLENVGSAQEALNIFRETEKKISETIKQMD